MAYNLFLPEEIIQKYINRENVRFSLFQNPSLSPEFLSEFKSQLIKFDNLKGLSLNFHNYDEAWINKEMSRTSVSNRYRIELITELMDEVTKIPDISKIIARYDV
jgi:hypothetical protein